MSKITILALVLLFMFQSSFAMSKTSKIVLGTALILGGVYATYDGYRDIRVTDYTNRITIIETKQDIIYGHYLDYNHNWISVPFVYTYQEIVGYRYDEKTIINNQDEAILGILAVCLGSYTFTTLKPSVKGNTVRLDYAYRF